MINAIHHIGLCVRDLDRAVAFFRAAVGFDPSPQCSVDGTAFFKTLTGRSDAVARTALLQAPNCYLELIAFDVPTPGEPLHRHVHEAGITHVCVQGQQMESLHARFVNAGAHFHAAPVGLGTGNLYAYARDPEFNVVELEALPHAPPSQTPWVAHVALATPNVARLAAFYHRLLGGARLGGTKIGPSPLYDQVTGLKGVEVIPTWIVGGNVSVELWQYLAPPTTPASSARPFSALGYNHVCFEVESAANALAESVEAGASADMQPLQADGATRAFVRDPDGNLLELLELAPERATCSVRRVSAYDIVAQVAARGAGQI